ncbi:MAG: BlaI/MecI/CopY family transcriptional regulator [Bacteroides sp.]|nr:BlaI/MecI/CopY family transcriptional regulator [Bacteroides sp.]
MQKLTIQEEEVMIYIWDLGECVIKDIVNKFPAPAPPYTTVASIVKNLERKGYVVPRRMGNTYLYRPAIRESEYKRSFMSQVVRNYFGDSYKELVSFFAKDQKISATELEDIIGMIEKGKAED